MKINWVKLSCVSRKGCPGFGAAFFIHCLFAADRILKLRFYFLSNVSLSLPEVIRWSILWYDRDPVALISSMQWYPGSGF